jgi:hypothetical protein
MLHQVRAFFAFALTFGFCPNAISAENVLGKLMAISKACSQDVQTLCSGAARRWPSDPLPRVQYHERLRAL